MGSINPSNRPSMPPSGMSAGRPVPPSPGQPLARSRDTYQPTNRPTPPPVQSHESGGSDLGKVLAGIGIVAGVIGLAAVLADDDYRPGYEPYPSDPYNHYPRPYDRPQVPCDPYGRPNPYDPYRRPVCPPDPRYHRPEPPRPYYPNDPWHRR